MHDPFESLRRPFMSRNLAIVPVLSRPNALALGSLLLLTGARGPAI